MAVVATQLVEQTPPTLEIRGSNPVFRKFLSNICLQSTVLKRSLTASQASKSESMLYLMHGYVSLSIHSDPTLAMDYYYLILPVQAFRSLQVATLF